MSLQISDELHSLEQNESGTAAEASSLQDADGVDIFAAKKARLVLLNACVLLDSASRDWAPGQLTTFINSTISDVFSQIV